MKKILVTGGSGFIGSHLVDGLLTAGHDVTIYDVETPRFGQECRFVKGDILDLERLRKAAGGMEIIYNLAAEANVNRFYESPLYSNLVTSHGVINVLQAARLCGIRRVIQASTEWIYGSITEDQDVEVTEETPYAQDPDHLYTSAKIAAELFVKNYATLYGVEYTIMRYGIPFGERARPETVTPIFLSKILNGEELTIHGDGSQTRQFIYVRDLAAGNVCCLSDNASNQVFNLNGTRKISVLEIVNALEGILKKRAIIKVLADRPGNFKGRYISSEKAKRLLGWEPRETYEAAMRSYANWCLNERRS